jgi:hypothetical protein
VSEPVARFYLGPFLAGMTIPHVTWWMDPRLRVRHTLAA